MSKLELKVIDTWKLGSDAVKNPKKYNGFLGVSLTSPYYNNETIELYLRSANNYFAKIALLPVDIPYKYNYIVFEGLSEDQATQKALDLGNRMEHFFFVTLRKLNLENKTTILRWQDIIKYKNCNYILTFLRTLLEKNSKFFNDVHLHIQEQTLVIEKRLLRAKQKLSDLEFEQQRKTLFRFLVDEIAIFIFVQEFLDYPIRLSAYPETDVTKNIYQASYNDLVSIWGLSGKIGHIRLLSEETS